MATNPVESPIVSNTAEDTLARKSRDADVVSGGHLVAKALKGEGVDTIFTLCGGHIIDIYDGCIDEGIRIVDVRHEQVAAQGAQRERRARAPREPSGPTARGEHDDVESDGGGDDDIITGVEPVIPTRSMSPPS